MCAISTDRGAVRQVSSAVRDAPHLVDSDIKNLWIFVHRTYPKWQEQSWRPHGIMSPPVNPWLKKEQRATEFSHMKRWQQGKLHQSAGETEPSK